MSLRILTGDCRDVLATLPDESVHCVVTSPPYFGLRDYGVAGQIGLEASPEAFVAEMVAVFRAVRRVLRKDGTLWLNLGDSYNAGRNGGHAGGAKQASLARHDGIQRSGANAPGLKPKDLIGIPWRVAFALQADGWWLRQDIIWSKPNPMPESITDRCTKAHEYPFLLSKSERYQFDAEAIAEPITIGNGTGVGPQYTPPGGGPPHRGLKGNAKTFRGGGAYTGGRSFSNSADVERSSHGNAPNEKGTRNKRSVWTVATSPFPQAHFATFPPDLITDCIAAGCPVGGTVLDPFGGAGTTGLVADRLGRDAILIELNPAYTVMARERLQRDGGMFANVASGPEPDSALPMAAE